MADGLGGHAAGEVASRIVVAAVHDMANAGEPIDTAALKSAVLRANQQVLDAAAKNSAYEGMGSTATVLHIDEEAQTACYAHVGDSRLYLLRAGALRRISRDHSYVEELVARGELSEAEAQHHPRKNYLLRAVGVEERLHVDGDTFPVMAGDRFLLATDGLTNMVEDADLCALLGGNPDDAARQMVERALDAGGTARSMRSAHYAVVMPETSVIRHDAQDETRPAGHSPLRARCSPAEAWGRTAGVAF